AGRVAARREVAVGGVVLDEGQGGGNGAEQLRVRCLCRLDTWLGWRWRDLRAAVRAVAARLRQLLEQPGDAWMRGDELGLSALEERPPLRRHRCGLLAVPV